MARTARLCFDALGIRLLRGSTFDERAATYGDHVVIDRSLAVRYWPGENAVGKRIRNIANDGWIYPGWLTVIGVVESVRHNALTAEPRPTVYVDFRQRPARLSSAAIVLPTSVPPHTLVDAARARLRAVDEDVPLEFSTMQRVVQNDVSERRFTMLVLGGFAALALLLAGVATYLPARRAARVDPCVALRSE